MVTFEETAAPGQRKKFQVISEHDPEGLVIDPGYLGIKRSPDCILIQITLNAGRSSSWRDAS